MALFNWGRRPPETTHNLSTPWQASEATLQERLHIIQRDAAISKALKEIDRELEIDETENTPDIQALDEELLSAEFPDWREN